MADTAPRRWSETDGPKRRWWRGQGGDPPVGADAWLAEARGGREPRWASLGRSRAASGDQLKAEAVLWQLVDAGLVAVAELRDRRGDWHPNRWRLTAAGEACAAASAGPADNLPNAIVALLADLAALLPLGQAEPWTQSVAAWLGSDAPRLAPTLARVVVAIASELLAGRRPRERVLSLQLAGHSKALRATDHRGALEVIFGLPFEALVRRHGQAALVYGPLRFRVGATALDALWSRPWLALTEDTIDAMADVAVDGDVLLSIENLTAFEEAVRAGDTAGRLALYTGGFIGHLERRVVELAAAAGIREVWHWGDLDPGGLAILRHLQQTLPIPVRAWRMDPELLERLPGAPLSAEDRRQLKGWVADAEAPVRALAAAMLARGVRCEQEGWYVAR